MSVIALSAAMRPDYRRLNLSTEKDVHGHGGSLEESVRSLAGRRSEERRFPDLPAPAWTSLFRQQRIGHLCQPTAL